MKRILLVLLLLAIGCWLLAVPCFAEPTPTPTPTSGVQEGWVYDPVVTELGRNSERARELLYWAFAHSPIYTAPVLGQMWGYSRNIVYLFFVLVLVLAGVGYIFFRSWRVPEIFSGISPPIVSSVVKFLIKLAGLLLYATFSYILVLGLIQFGEVLIRFFIERIGGCNLFNIKFVSGVGTEKCVWPGDPEFQQVVMQMEKNYTEFLGYRNLGKDMVNLEMINTSMFVIRLTNLTYNVMAALLFLRHVILWFVLILSPFLALLTPFIFIRNVGWIWIGVFFQWLFYGPLMALFVAGLTRIWQAGIPYQFDFSRVDKDIGQIFPTSINILYGGPAQTLTPTNSANYVDTYAEYIIALIMLWACMFLPWLLLRIFRDYCCIGGEGQTTLRQILDRLRGAPLPPPPQPPPTTIAEAIKLPFRKKAEIPKKITLERIVDVSKAETQQLAQAMNLSVASLQEVAQFEMNREMQRQVRINLDKISQPDRITRSEERERFSQVRSELFARAARGDRTAQKIISAVRREPKEVFKVTPAIVPTQVPRIEPRVISDVAQKTKISEEKISKILQAVPMAGIGPERTKVIARQTGVPEEKVFQVLKTIPTITKPAIVVPPAKPAMVTVEDYEEVKKMWVNHYQESGVPVTEKVKTREAWVENDIKKLTNALNLLTSIKEDDKQKGIEQVANILPFLLLGGFSDLETITYLKAKLEAARYVLEILEEKEKVKEKAKEEEELVEIPAKEKEEKLKEMELKAKREREIPGTGEEKKVEKETQSVENPKS